MRRTSRPSFAAPLVIVTACGAPRAAHPPPPPLDRPVAALTVDAGLEATPDAPLEPSLEAPPVATSDVAAAAAAAAAAPAAGVRPGRALVHIAARTIQPEGFVSCHDFGPGSRGCNPPRPQRVPASTHDVPILDVSPDSDGTRVILPLGEADGLERGWNLAILTPSRSPAPAARPPRLQKRMMIIATNLTAAEVRGGLELELAGRAGAPWTPLVPPPVEAAIVERVARGGRTTITVAVGRLDHVERGWSAVLLDAAGTPVRGGRGVVVEAGSSTSVVRIAAPARRLLAATTARLAPPRKRR